MKLSGLRLDNPFVQAPMSGITDHAFRSIARRFHGGLLHTEMVSAEALCRGSARTIRMATVPDEHRPCAIQLVGHDPGRLAQAAEIAASLGGDVIDLNAGCPEPKVTRPGGGAAMLRRLGVLESAVERMAASAGAPVSVKARLGWDRDSSADILAAAERGGASHVAFHGRLAVQGYSGDADWGALARLATAAKVPFIANGDARDEEGACRLLRSTGARGVMLGRATRGRPFLPGTAFAALQGRRPRRFSGEELAAAVIDHAMLLADSEGERRGMLKMRKHAHWYLVAAKARYKKAAVHKIDSVAGLRSFLEGVAWPD